MARSTPAHRSNKNKAFKRAHDLKRKLKDEDVIYNEYINPKAQAVDVDLPGLGQFYCASCSKHFKDEEARGVHYQSALHKRLLKKIRNEKPYTPEEAAAAAGLGSYTYSKKGLKPGEKTLGEKLAEAEAAKAADAEVAME